MESDLQSSGLYRRSISAPNRPASAEDPLPKFVKMPLLAAVRSGSWSTPPKLSLDTTFVYIHHRYSLSFGSIESPCMPPLLDSSPPVRDSYRSPSVESTSHHLGDDMFPDDLVLSDDDNDSMPSPVTQFPPYSPGFSAQASVQIMQSISDQDLDTVDSPRDKVIDDADSDADDVNSKPIITFPPHSCS
jgi:hypothetical protein